MHYGRADSADSPRGVADNMARITWPPTISDKPLQDAYQETIGNRLKRTKPDAGPAKVRRRAGKHPNTIHPTFLFHDYAQMLLFLDWVDDVRAGLAGGAKVFEWTHPLTKKILIARFVPASDDALFVFGPYKQSSPWWSVATTLEILP